jgi:UDP-N-acetylglucosamine:LPS N-acetylglucosamine transferase
MKILAISSEGGHWEQLQIISAAFSRHRVYYASTNPHLLNARDDVLFVPDCNRHKILQIVKSAWCVNSVIGNVRPDVIVTTGAAPGLLAIILGRLRGIHTIWIDSVANAERLSMSGRLANSLAHLCLTQWPHLARKEGPQFFGSIL